MKTMCPPGYHHNGFVATHALGHICTCISYTYAFKLDTHMIFVLYMTGIGKASAVKCEIFFICFFI